MGAAGSMAGFAADIPFGDALRLDVVVDRVAAIAERTGRPLHIVVWIKRRPPVGVLRHMVGQPARVRDVPLRRQREIVVALAREIALLPPAAIDKGDVVQRERQFGVGLREVGNDGVGMFARIAHDIGHARLLPPGKDFLVAGFARGRADIMRAGSDWGRRARSASPAGPTAASDAGKRRSARFRDPADPRRASPYCECRH